MKKTFTVIITVAIVVLTCTFVLSGCISSMKSVQKKYEKKGYIVDTIDYQNKDENANYYSETVNWQLSATPNSNSGILGAISDVLKTTVYTCYYKSDVAKTYYENANYKTYKEAGDDEYCKYISGKVVVLGIKSSIKVGK